MSAGIGDTANPVFHQVAEKLPILQGTAGSTTGQSTFSQSLNMGNKDMAVQEVANISIVAVVPLCVPTLKQRRAPWAR